ncbi:MAG: hypothetical protein ABI723_12485 [Bacteroidia bacterium]
MRKTILSYALVVFAFAANAQENMMSKRGTPILPEVGDYAISFDATPFLRYAGNMFNQNGNEAPTADYTYNNPFTITGLYVNAPNSAYRAKLRLGFGSTSQDQYAELLLDGGNPNHLLTTNKTKVNATNITIGLGMQKSRGKHRLHANYGVDAMLTFGTGLDTTYTYGQKLNENTQTPTLGPRPTKVNSGSTFGFSVRGFIGVEYFFAPKISFGAEYGWGIGIATHGKGTNTDEFVDSSSGADIVVTGDTKTGKSSHFGADIDNKGGAIAITFYF